MSTKQINNEELFNIVSKLTDKTVINKLYSILLKKYKKPIDKQKIEQAKKLRLQGLSYKQIALKMKLGYETVRRYILYN